MNVVRLLVALLLRLVLVGGVVCIVGWMLMTAPLIFCGFVLVITLLTLAVKLGV